MKKYWRRLRVLAAPMIIVGAVAWSGIALYVNIYHRGYNILCGPDHICSYDEMVEKFTLPFTLLTIRNSVIISILVILTIIIIRVVSRLAKAIKIRR